MMYYALMGQVYQEFPQGLVLGFACKGKTVAEVFLDYISQTDWQARWQGGMIMPTLDAEARQTLFEKCSNGTKLSIDDLKSWRSNIGSETSATIAVTTTRPDWYKPRAKDRSHITQTKLFHDFEVREVERMAKEG